MVPFLPSHTQDCVILKGAEHVLERSMKGKEGEKWAGSGGSVDTEFYEMLILSARCPRLEENSPGAPGGLSQLSI